MGKAFKRGQEYAGPYSSSKLSLDRPRGVDESGNLMGKRELTEIDDQGSGDYIAEGEAVRGASAPLPKK
jgi:hypothetical protein